MTIQPCTIADLQQAPNFGVLLAEYCAECGIPELGPANPQWDTYKRLEDAALLVALGAFEATELVGFAVVLIHDLPHFGKRMGVTESLFVAGHARKGGTGLQLLDAAERASAERGAEGLLVSAPTGGRLEALMQAMPRYRPASRVFFRSLT